MKFPFSIFKIAGSSMEPFYKNGERVVVKKWLLSPTINDVVILKDPRNSKIIIKRIVKISHSGASAMESSSKGSKGTNGTKGEILYFVLGDNKQESTDSRHFGWIKKKQIIGQVIWPKRV